MSFTHFSHHAPSHPRGLYSASSSSTATRRFPGDSTDDDDDDGDPGFDIPLRIRPINSNMDRLLFGAAGGGGGGGGAPGGMPARLNYGFGMGGGGWGSNFSGGRGGGGGGGFNWMAPPPPAAAASQAAESVPRGMVGLGQGGDGLVDAMGGVRLTGTGGAAGESMRRRRVEAELRELNDAENDGDADGEDEDEEEDVPLKLKTGGGSAFDNLLAEVPATGSSSAPATTTASARQPSQPSIPTLPPPLPDNHPNLHDPTTPTPAASAPTIGSTSPYPTSTVQQRSTPQTPKHWNDPPQSPRETPLTPRPIPLPLDLSLADLTCSDSDSEDDNTNNNNNNTTTAAQGNLVTQGAGSTPAPGVVGRGRVRKARGQTPNRRLTAAELESLPDRELLAQALAALGYCARREEEDEEEGEDGKREEGEGDAGFGNEFASRGGGIPGVGRRERSAVGQDEEPLAGGVKLRKGRGNFGMQWGVM
ncbi:hypothetical protein L211DRAFT_851062 [Terfezia boudieri ATCC MYA-4762]|uniref:Uncharacterized protein n=1 Tax=Terfezia boudieri ATCC MYA-4762 TaxID=1051890 RepID=A0A3N4LK30_9PEZI|nr:hypothetical protein L211DRAFT_851062 [Terfezia boudieri ATCC MYA-4762]